jgi:prevent-host-death family protein
MSRTVSVSELKAQLSKYLRLVRRGEVLLVSDRNRVVARLEGAGPTASEPDASRIARLESAGILRRRKRALDDATLRRRVRAKANVVASLLEEREEGR